MELIIILLYMFVSGIIYISWLWNTEYSLMDKLMTIMFGFMGGWLITPILIGQALAKIYDGK